MSLADRSGSRTLACVGLCHTKLDEPAIANGDIAGQRRSLTISRTIEPMIEIGSRETDSSIDIRRDRIVSTSTLALGRVFKLLRRCHLFRISAISRSHGTSYRGGSTGSRPSNVPCPRLHQSIGNPAGRTAYIGVLRTRSPRHDRSVRVRECSSRFCTIGVRSTILIGEDPIIFGAVCEGGCRT